MTTQLTDEAQQRTRRRRRRLTGFETTQTERWNARSPRPAELSTQGCRWQRLGRAAWRRMHEALDRLERQSADASTDERQRLEREAARWKRVLDDALAYGRELNGEEDA